MTANGIMQEIKEALNGRPGQPIVLGVCNTLSARMGREPWCVRLAAIVLGVFWTIPALAAYIILGFTLTETEHRTRGFFSGLGVLARETAEKAFEALGRIFGPDRPSRDRGF